MKNKPKQLQPFHEGECILIKRKWGRQIAAFITGREIWQGGHVEGKKMMIHKAVKVKLKLEFCINKSFFKK